MNGEINHSVRIPSIWSCKISTGWINLARVRKIEPVSIVDEPMCCLVTWEVGEEVFVGENAIAIIESWKEAHRKYGLN